MGTAEENCGGWSFMNLVHILLNAVAATPESPKWTEIVQTLTGIVSAIPVLDWIHEKFQGNVAKINPYRALKKAQKLVSNLVVISLEILLKLIPTNMNTQKIKDILQKIRDTNKELQNEINALKIRSNYQKSAAEWLNTESKREQLSIKVAKIALKNSRNAQELEAKEQFQQNIQQSLVLIYNCLDKFGRRNSLSQFINGLHHNELKVKPQLYIIALDALKKEARNDLVDSKVYEEVENYLQHLEDEFSKKFLSK